ncbi:hypothetical protein SUGI_1496680 [Cryptomeria japonica]|uniref:Tropomyosin n=1 Tax=Cryptomeria japonica TaxID=3369 RepID=A0AAD3RPX3_CRYJA|nr:hypothetical protein SUGI_1496680 [Cryptomeria japonica]
MEVIRKKLQTFKADLENAIEKAEQSDKQLKEHKARADQAESEVSSLNRRIQLLEDELERSEERLKVSSQKLEEASQMADEDERVRKMFEHRKSTDEDRIEALESSLRETKTSSLRTPIVNTMKWRES